MLRWALVLVMAGCSGGASVDEPVDTDRADTEAVDTEPADTDAPDTDVVDPPDTDDTVPPDTDDSESPVDTDPPPDTDDAGACVGAADVAALAAVVDTIDDVTQACTFQCIRASRPARCVSTCIQGDVGLSAGCADCFGQISTCITSNCLLDCIDATSAACATCRQTKCEPAFLTCAGISPP